MSASNKVKDTAKAGDTSAGGSDAGALANSLRFEQEKNEVLLAEVVALEDELVNRQLGDFVEVISDRTKDFWREQLLSNRSAGGSPSYKPGKESGVLYVSEV